MRGGSGVFRKSKDRKRFLANYLEVISPIRAQLLSNGPMVRGLRSATTDTFEEFMGCCIRDLQVFAALRKHSV